MGETLDVAEKYEYRASNLEDDVSRESGSRSKLASEDCSSDLG